MANNDNSVSFKPLVVAVLVALLGMVFIRQHLEGERQKLEASVDEVAVLTVAKAIRAGDPLDSGDLSFRLVDRADQPWSTIKFEDPAIGPDAKRRYEDIRAMLHGRLANRPIEVGEILLWTDLDDREPRQLSALFEGRRRAVSVRVDDASLMGGLLQPNDRVDVLATFPAGMAIRGGISAEAHDKTMVILEDVTVLAIGGRMSVAEGSGRSGGNSVSLALDPEQALLLSHVQKGATISLLLRPMGSESAGKFGEEPGDREVSSPDVQASVEKLMSP